MVTIQGSALALKLSAQSSCPSPMWHAWGSFRSPRHTNGCRCIISSLPRAASGDLPLDVLSTNSQGRVSVCPSCHSKQPHTRVRVFSQGLVEQFPRLAHKEGLVD